LTITVCMADSISADHQDHRRRCVEARLGDQATVTPEYPSLKNSGNSVFLIFSVHLHRVLGGIQNSSFLNVDQASMEAKSAKPHSTARGAVQLILSHMAEKQACSANYCIIRQSHKGGECGYDYLTELFYPREASPLGKARKATNGRERNAWARERNSRNARAREWKGQAREHNARAGGGKIIIRSEPP